MTELEEPPLDLDDATRDAQLLHHKQRLLELRQQQLAAVRRNGSAFYRPYDKQEQFHLSTAKRRAFFAGNRSGKSTAGVLEDVAWVIGERLWYPKGDNRRTLGIPARAVKGLVLTVDWDKVDEIFTSDRGDSPGKFWRYLPADFIVSKRRNHTGVFDQLVGANGSTLSFDTVKSWLNNPGSIESSDWDFIHIDEPIPELMWKGAARGLMDRAGCAWFTLTSLSEPWITDYFAGRGSEVADTDRFSIRASVYDNPHISREEIARFIEELNEDEVQCRIYGHDLERAGTIYKQFDPARHVLKAVPLGWTDFATPPPEYTTFVYIDPHPRTPSAVMFAAVPPAGFPLFIYDEIFVHCLVEPMCELIKARIAGRNVGWMRIDPAAFIENPVTGSTMAEEFWRHGFPVERAVKDLEHGIMKVAGRLSEGKDNPAATSIYFSPHLKETIWEFGHYVWATHRGRPTNKPKDADDHMMENLYRLCLDEPIYIDPVAAARPLTFLQEL